MIDSGQVASINAGATGYVDCWFTKNGKDLTNSSVRLSVDKANSTGLLISQFITKLSVEDILGVSFSASGPALGFVFIKPDIAPGIPSFILSITKIE